MHHMRSVFYIFLAIVVVFVSLPISTNAKSNDLYIGPKFNTPTKSYVIFDRKNESISAGKNPYDVRPIASLTKLMTAMVAIDEGFDLSLTTKYNHKKHWAYRNYMRLRTGDILNNRDLWYSMLTGSMNVPARMIVDSTGLSEKEFIKKMNEKAMNLGLADTQFVDVHGLSPKNVGSASSMAKLLDFSLMYSDIKRALSMKSYAFDEVVSVDRRYHHQFRHTNMMLRRKGLSIAVNASKTGYLHESGPCLAFETTLTHGNYIIVTLGESSWWRRHREPKRLANWWNNLSLSKRSETAIFLVKYPNDPKVYAVTEKGKEWIPNEKEFVRRGFKWNEIMTILPDEKITLGGVRVL